MADEREAYKGTSSEETLIEKTKWLENLAISSHYLMKILLELSLYKIHTVFFGYT